MPRTAEQILEEARQLPPGEIEWLVCALMEEETDERKQERFAAWQKEIGEPEPGYEEWFKAGVEEALADTSPDTPHEEVMAEIHSILQRARDAHQLKASA